MNSARIVTRRNSSSPVSRLCHCPRGGSADGGGRRQLRQRGDQVFLPGLALELPDAERDQDRKGREQRRSRAAAALRLSVTAGRRRRAGLPPPYDGIAARSAGPSPAATAAASWRGSAEPRATRAASRAAGRATSTTSAATTTTKPANDITKNAGPSAESAKAKSWPQFSQRGATLRNPANSAPCPQRGQRPARPRRAIAQRTTWSAMRLAVVRHAVQSKHRGGKRKGRPCDRPCARLVRRLRC